MIGPEMLSEAPVVVFDPGGHTVLRCHSGVKTKCTQQHHHDGNSMKKTDNNCSCKINTAIDKYSSVWIVAFPPLADNRVIITRIQEQHSGAPAEGVLFLRQCYDCNESDLPILAFLGQEDLDAVVELIASFRQMKLNFKKYQMPGRQKIKLLSPFSFPPFSHRLGILLQRKIKRPGHFLWMVLIYYILQIAIGITKSVPYDATTNFHCKTEQWKCCVVVINFTVSIFWVCWGTQWLKGSNRKMTLESRLEVECSDLDEAKGGEDRTIGRSRTNTATVTTTTETTETTTAVRRKGVRKGVITPKTIEGQPAEISSGKLESYARGSNQDRWREKEIAKAGVEGRREQEDKLQAVFGCRLTLQPAVTKSQTEVQRKTDKLEEGQERERKLHVEVHRLHFIKRQLEPLRVARQPSRLLSPAKSQTKRFQSVELETSKVEGCGTPNSFYAMDTGTSRKEAGGTA